MARLRVGDRAPAFTLKDEREKNVSLSDLVGSRLVLYFYPADDTPGCTTEARQFNDATATLSERGVLVLGVSPDNAASHVAFRNKLALNFSLLSDPDKSVMIRYGAYGEKMNYGQTIMGVIRSTVVIGPTGIVEHVFYNVRANGHAAKVVAALSS